MSIFPIGITANPIRSEIPWNVFYIILGLAFLVKGYFGIFEKNTIIQNRYGWSKQIYGSWAQAAGYLYTIFGFWVTLSGISYLLSFFIG